MAENSDEQLIRQYLSGDSKSLDLLIKRYLPSVYRLARYYSRSRFEAEDIAQDVFLKMWRSLKKFKPDKSFKVWLLAIARNASIDYLRKRKLVSLAELSEEQEDLIKKKLVDPAPLPDEQIARRDFYRIVRLKLKALPEKYCSVIILHLEQELTFKEISGLLEEPLNTVKSRYLRGLNLLREKLNQTL